jgi:Lrp/AsnC ligand binding domain
VWFFRQKGLAAARTRPSIVRVSPGGDFSFEALVCVRTDAHTAPDRFLAYLREEPSVAQAWRVAADIDAVVWLVCTSLADLDAAVARMRHLGGAEHTVTHLVLEPLRSGGRR